jgi:hypothetical protein
MAASKVIRLEVAGQPNTLREKTLSGDVPTTEIAAFFQSWLHFGCAIEVLAVSGVAAQPSDLSMRIGNSSQLDGYRFLFVSGGEK